MAGPPSEGCMCGRHKVNLEGYMVGYLARDILDKSLETVVHGSTGIAACESRK